MAKKTKKIAENATNDLSVPQVDSIFIMPQFAYRFRVKFSTNVEKYDTVLCRQIEYVKYDLVNKTIEMSIRESANGSTAHALINFVNSITGKLQIDGFGATGPEAEPSYTLYPLGLKLVEHNSILDYSINDVQTHKLKFTFTDLNVL